MGFFEKMEAKFGRYAIRNLMLYIIILYIGGFALFLIDPDFYIEHLSLNMERVLHGEIWRLLTYVMYPPSTSLLWFLLECFIFYMLGSNLEKLWGPFYLNLYVFIGYLAQILGALLVYLIGHKILLMSPANLYTSFFLAIAMTMPETRFYLYMIIPVKAKYLAYLYGGLMAFELVTGDWTVRVSVITTLVNVVIFFLFIRKPIVRVKQYVRRMQFEEKVKTAEKVVSVKSGGARHRCAVCGRTELDDPNLEFRYCSKCAGGREYCMEHLYTHVHVTEADEEKTE